MYEEKQAHVNLLSISQLHKEKKQFIDNHIHGNGRTDNNQEALNKSERI